jgi:hypothetical protein
MNEGTERFILACVHVLGQLRYVYMTALAPRALTASSQFCKGGYTPKAAQT